MIPGMRQLEDAVRAVTQSVPPELARGELTASVYGLGFLGRWAVRRLQEQRVKLAACYDANEAMAGSIYEGLPIRPASALKLDRPAFMIVTARHASRAVSAMLAGFGIPHVSYDAWYAAANFEDFRRVHDDVLADAPSRDTLRAVLMTMLTGDPGYCASVAQDRQYFCLPPFARARDEHFIDAGAFDGDSVEQFIVAHEGAFSKIYAFEPGARQFASLQARVARLRESWHFRPGAIELVNAGLGARDYSARAGNVNGELTNLAVGYASAGNDAEFSIVGLDRFLQERRVTFLKADVEGMEMDLLEGARATIQRQKPKISICVYHYPPDIPAISGYLASLVPGYRFALRHHSAQLMETVLYCWIE